MKKYFLYTRKSSDSEDRQILSIEAQLTELREFIARIDGVSIVEEFIETRTAKEPGRPIFNKMISRIELGEAEGIVAWHPDRLARNSVDGGKIIHLIDKGCVKELSFPTYRFDNTAQGKFMLNIIFGQSKYYVDNLSENVKRGIRQKLRRGEWPSYALIGYINNLRTKKIEIDPIIGPKIKELFEMYATGERTLDDIARYARSIGLCGRAKHRPLSKSNIHRLLSNPIYYGLIKYNGESYEGKHEPIVSKALFDKVQSILKYRSHPRPVKHTFLLAGLIKCSTCGGMITAESQKGHTYYRCTKKRGTCNTPYVREEVLTDQINQRIQQVLIPDDFLAYLKAQIAQERMTIANSASEEVKRIDQQINDLDNKISRLMDLYLENEITKRDFGRRKETLLDAKYKLEQELKYLEQGQFYWLELVEEFVNGLTKPKKMLETNDLEAKRKFLENIGSNFSLGLVVPGGGEWAVSSPLNGGGGYQSPKPPQENSGAAVAVTDKNGHTKKAAGGGGKPLMTLTFQYKKM